MQVAIYTRSSIGMELLRELLPNRPDSALQSALEGLTDRGWLLLSRNWGLFFAALGIANHVMYVLIQRGEFSFDTWLTIKVWGITALSFLFTLTQVPVMLKNGLAVPEEPATDKS